MDEIEKQLTKTEKAHERLVIALEEESSNEGCGGTRRLQQLAAETHTATATYEEEWARLKELVRENVPPVGSMTKSAAKVGDGAGNEPGEDGANV